MNEQLENHPYAEKAKSKLSRQGINYPKPLVSRAEYDAGTTTASCEKHGQVEVRELNGILRMIQSTCQKCIKEYEAKALVIADELKAESEAKIISDRLYNSGVTERHFDKTFDNYVVDTKERKFALDSMKYFVNKIMDGECKNMILCGSVGTGKTHLCQAAIRYMVENTNQSNILMATIKEIIRYVRKTWSKDSENDEQTIIDRLSNKQLLIIDEMGIQTGSDNELDIIFEIINNRYENRLPTVIISNLEKNELVDLLGNRIIDRLKEDGCRVLGMAWDSYRETNKRDF